MSVGLVVTSLKKYSVERLLSHDRDLKGCGFGFQRRLLGPVTTFETFPFLRLAGAAGRQRPGARRPSSPSPAGARGPAATAAHPRGEEPGPAGRGGAGGGDGRVPPSAPSPARTVRALRLRAGAGSWCGGQGQWRRRKARNLSCARLARQTAGRGRVSRRIRRRWSYS